MKKIFISRGLQSNKYGVSMEKNQSLMAKVWNCSAPSTSLVTIFQESGLCSDARSNASNTKYAKLADEVPGVSRSGVPNLGYMYS